jgi:hypothetical protein
MLYKSVFTRFFNTSAQRKLFVKSTYQPQNVSAVSAMCPNRLSRAWSFGPSGADAWLVGWFAARTSSTRLYLVSSAPDYKATYIVAIVA